MAPTSMRMIRDCVTIFLRLALAAGFATAVTDRFGFWGPPGAANVAWGDFQRFTAYTGQLNPWLPAPLIPPLAWFVTVVEVVLASTLIAGIGTRYGALGSGVLLTLFALGMTVGTGVKSALNASVFAAAASAFALATAGSYRWSLDGLLASGLRPPGETHDDAAPSVQRDLGATSRPDR